MAFFFELIILFVLLLALILAFMWLHNAQHPEQQQSTPPTQYTINEAYHWFRTDYEQFAMLLHQCLFEMQNSCGIECPANAERIFCGRIDDRVYLSGNNMITFRYEVPLQFPCGLSNVGKDITPQIRAIESTLRSNLPNYMDAGYFINGPICVFGIPHYRIRIEVHDVRRETPMQGGEMWW